MTLLETDRLVRKLRDALRSPESVARATAAGPAQAYSDACAVVRHRLEQCAALLDAGDEQQALQLAESPPPRLIDLVALLAFSESAQWREFCQSHGLPAPAPFDQRIINRINGLYARGITLQHPLYRDYRAHTMKHRPDEALATLRSIVRLNPADANARAELLRLEGKQQAAQLDRLAQLLAANDEPAVIALVNQIEETAQNLGLTPDGPIWTQGMTVRFEQYRREAAAECLALLPQLDTLHHAGDWKAVSAVLAHARSLQSSVELQLDAGTRGYFEQMQSWVDKKQRENTRHEDFAKAVAELEFVIEQSERRQAVASTANLLALQAEVDTLHNRWRAVESHDQAIPDGLEARFRKRANIVRLEIERAQKRRTTLLATGCVLLAVLCATGIYYFFQSQKTSETAGQLERLVATRQVEAAAKFLGETHAKDPARLEPAAVKAAAARAQAFIDTERERQRALALHLSALEALAAETPKPFASQDLAKTSADLEAAAKDTAALAPDFLPAAEARLAAVRNRWESVLSGESTTRETQFAATLDTVEKRAADQLNYRSPDDLRHALEALYAGIEQLTTVVTETAAIPQLKIRDDLAARYEALSAKLTAYRKDLVLYDDARAGMTRATTLDEYLQALRNGQNSELGRSGRDLGPAKHLLSLPLSNDAVQTAALLSGDGEAWKFLKTNPSAGLVPTSAVADAEQRIYDQLLVDSNIRNVYVYHAESAPNASGSKKGLIYARGKLIAGILNDGWAVNPRGMYYDTMLIGMALNFTEGQFLGKVRDEAVAPETQALLDLHFRDVIDANTNRFAFGRTGAPVQEFLDRLTRAKASGIFKAFVLDRVCQMVQSGERAEFFGWQYSPALRAHYQEAQGLGIPRSGDWMVPDEIKRKGAAFDLLFSKAARISYTDEARLLQAATRDAAAAKVVFRGYADAAGVLQPAAGASEPTTNATSTPPDLWGWESANGKAARLFVWSTAAKAYKPAVASLAALPLTPLLALDGDGHEILRTAAKKLGIGDDEIKAESPYLPPYFQN